MKRIIKFILILLGIFFGGVFITIIFYPNTNNEELQAYYTGQGIFYSALITLFIWAIYGSYKKLKNKNNAEGSIERNKKHSLKKIIIITGIIIAVTSFVFWSVSSTIHDAVSTQTDIQSKGWTEASKTSFKKGILDSCGSGSIKVCTCVADYLINKYTLDELTEWQQEYKETSTPPQKLKEATNTCSIK